MMALTVQWWIRNIHNQNEQVSEQCWHSSRSDIVSVSIKDPMGKTVSHMRLVNKYISSVGSHCTVVRP